MQRIRLSQAGLAAALTGAFLAAATASAAGPPLFLTNADARVSKGQPAEVLLSPLNLEVDEQVPASCSQVQRNGSVTATGKPTAKLALTGEEVETECPSGSLFGYIKGVSLTNANGQIQVTVQSKGGLVMEAPIGKRRCAYGASKLVGDAFIGPELSFVLVSAAGKLNTKYSSPGCPTTAELEGHVTLSPPGEEAFETEA